MRVRVVTLGVLGTLIANFLCSSIRIVPCLYRSGGVLALCGAFIGDILGCLTSLVLISMTYNAIGRAMTATSHTYGDYECVLYKCAIKARYSRSSAQGLLTKEGYRFQRGYQVSGFYRLCVSFFVGVFLLWTCLVGT